MIVLCVSLPRSPKQTATHVCCVLTARPESRTRLCIGGGRIRISGVKSSGVLHASAKKSREVLHLMFFVLSCAAIFADVRAPSHKYRMSSDLQAQEKKDCERCKQRKLTAGKDSRPQAVSLRDYNHTKNDPPVTAHIHSKCRTNGIFSKSNIILS